MVLIIFFLLIVFLMIISLGGRWTQLIGFARGVHFRNYATTPGHERTSPNNLFKVVLVGDSLTKNFYVTSPLKICAQWLLNVRSNSFLNTDADAGGLLSYFQMMSSERPTLAVDLGRPGASVLPVQNRNSLVSRMFCVNRLRDQVDQIVKLINPPDLVLVWIGHNDLDYKAQNLSHDEIANKFCEEFKLQMKRLLFHLNNQEGPSAVIVFGLANHRSFFEARDKCELARSQNPERFPFFDLADRTYTSMKKENRARMVELADRLDVILEHDVVSALERESKPGSQSRIYFSKALSELEISDDELLNPMDAWHPSVEGHSRIAKAMFAGAQPVLKELRK